MKQRIENISELITTYRLKLIFKLLISLLLFHYALLTLRSETHEARQACLILINKAWQKN